MIIITITTNYDHILKKSLIVERQICESNFKKIVDWMEEHKHVNSEIKANKIDIN